MKMTAFILGISLLWITGCGPEKIEDVQIDWRPFEVVADHFPIAPKPLFLYVREDNCVYCDEMDSLIFTRPEVAQFLNEHFTPVRITLRHEMQITIRGKHYYSHEFRKLLSIEGTPAYYFFDTRGRINGVLDSSMDLLRFKRTLIYVMNGHFGRTTWPEFIKLPEADLGTEYGVF